VVARYFPDYPAFYARHGYTMFESIDRVYVATHAEQRLGFVCHTNFRESLDRLAAEP
jgi:UDP-glucose 4-epimerase